MVSQTIREIFKSMSGSPEEEKIQDLFQHRIAGNRAMQKKLNFELGKNREQLTRLQMEIAKTLTGDSVYSPEVLNTLMHQADNEPDVNISMQGMSLC